MTQQTETKPIIKVIMNILSNILIGVLGLFIYICWLQCLQAGKEMNCRQYLTTVYILYEATA